MKKAVAALFLGIAISGCYSTARLPGSISKAASSCAEYLPLWADWASYSDGKPSSPRALGIARITDGYYINDGNGLQLHNLQGQRLGSRRFVTNPPGDYDWVLFNVSVNPDGSGVVSCWQNGTFIFGPNLRGTKVIDTISEGALAFEHLGHRYYLAVGWTAPAPDGVTPVKGCGTGTLWPEPTLWRETLLGFELLQCVPRPGNRAAHQPVEPPWVQSGEVPELAAAYRKKRNAVSSSGTEILNGVKIGGHVYAVFSSAHMVPYRIIGSGSGLTLVPEATSYPRAYAHFGNGFEYHEGRQLLVTSVFGISKLWDVNDPGSPVELADLNHPGNGGIASFNTDGTLAYIGRKASAIGWVFDVSNPSHPKLVAEYLTEHPNRKRFDAEPYRDGWVEADYETVGPVDTSACLPLTSVFSDGFESGDTSSWSVVIS